MAYYTNCCPYIHISGSVCVVVCVCWLVAERFWALHLLIPTLSCCQVNRNKQIMYLCGREEGSERYTSRWVHLTGEEFVCPLPLVSFISPEWRMLLCRPAWNISEESVVGLMSFYLHFLMRFIYSIHQNEINCSKKHTLLNKLYYEEFRCKTL